MNDDILEKLNALGENQRQMLAKQDELLTFVRDEAAKAGKIRDEAMAIQRTAVARVRRISYLGAPAIVLCVVLLVYLIAKYRVLF